MNLQNLQIPLILLLLIAGCGRDKYEDMQKSDIFDDLTYVQLEVAQGYGKKRHATHKFAQKEEREFENLEKINVLDHCLSKDKAYFLMNNHLVVLNTQTYQHKTVELPAGPWSHVKKTKHGVVIYGKSQRMLVWKPGKDIVEHKLPCLVAKVFDYNNYLIIVFTNGLVMCYDPDEKKKVWDTGTGFNQNKSALENAVIHDDKVLFVNASGHLVSVDLDSGEADMTYVKKSASKTNVITTKDGICAMSGETILIKLSNKDQNTISISGLKSIQALGDYVILEKQDAYIITNAKLLFNKKFISKIDKTDKNSRIFVYKKLFGTISPESVNTYDINTGDLVQKIPISGKLRYGVFADKRILLLVDNSVRVYN